MTGRRRITVLIFWKTWQKHLILIHVISSGKWEHRGPQTVGNLTLMQVQRVGSGTHIFVYLKAEPRLNITNNTHFDWDCFWAQKVLYWDVMSCSFRIIQMAGEVLEQWVQIYWTEVEIQGAMQLSISLWTVNRALMYMNQHHGQRQYRQGSLWELNKCTERGGTYGLTDCVGVCSTPDTFPCTVSAAVKSTKGLALKPLGQSQWSMTPQPNKRK